MGDSLIRRFYLIKLVECYVETLGITLNKLGIDTDTYKMNYHSVIADFQQHILYGFLVGVLVAMANTSPEELDKLCDEKLGRYSSLSRKSVPAASAAEKEALAKYAPLTDDRLKYLVDLMRDIAYYVESKDFELGLPVTNFRRYHELWCMKMEEEEEYEDYGYVDEE